MRFEAIRQDALSDSVTFWRLILETMMKKDFNPTDPAMKSPEDSIRLTEKVRASG
jgi:hypothetical protein